jgi:3-phenylpropionate/trans-cinnamate dioxygenase ferredoxin reductase subunit
MLRPLRRHPHQVSVRGAAGMRWPMAEPGVIVIGSGPAGVSAAEAFRNYDGIQPLRILTEDPDLPYARPPLSKDYLRGDTNDVSLHPPQWFRERAIEVVHEVPLERIDIAGRRVIAGGTTFPYSELVLACGASPTALPVPGGDGALQLRSLADASRLRQAAAQASSAVVVGAGFIGCEAAASLASQGILVTLVAPDTAPQEKRLGAEAGQRMLGLLRAADVRYVGKVAVKAIHGQEVILDNGTTLDTDLVLAATGVTPNSEAAQAAGLRMEDSRVVTSADMRTSAEGVYAAGDVAWAFNATAGRNVAVEHWQDAIDQGAVAGAAMAGQSVKWDAVPGFWSTIGDSTIKYHAWGDGYQNSRLVEHDDGFTVWYVTDNAVVGVLTCNADDDYDLGETLIAARRPAPVSMG